ncbi:DUF5908 family protein [Negadavirga shengliensis]|uniref:DUF5908 family protein n=1 Tax=Negadavirga shengliensis TaxID=1389218 RepID=A0ABV9T5C1_9BACT
MPIEIKELHIKGTVANEEDRGASQSPSEGDQKAIIEACVEKVLKILEDKKQR